MTNNTWRFVRHFLEMVAAMVVGVMALGPLWSLAGWSVLQRPDLSAIVMATNMTVGMSLWMRYRGHSWASTGEMAAAMYVPFLVLLVPFWTGVVSGDTLLLGGHGLMLPAMVIAMLRRHVHAGA